MSRLLFPILAALAAMSFTGLARSQPPEKPLMKVPGNMMVHDSGAATFTLPVRVSPGTAGMVPALELKYNSHAAESSMGLGWFVEQGMDGKVTIRRCNPLPQGIIQFGTGDDFCLGTVPLVAVNGAYGEDQTEYRTEMESFSKIVSYGNLEQGPAWFRIWTVTGQILDLGNTEDSRYPNEAGRAPTTWAWNRIEDAAGNYISITHIPDNALQQLHPLRFDYTGHAAAGLTPYNSVRLEYTQNSSDGAAADRPLLTAVKNFHEEHLVSEYRIEYAEEHHGTFALVAAISLCDGNGACLPATRFNWSPVDVKPEAAASPDLVFPSAHITSFEDGLGFTSRVTYERLNERGEVYVESGANGLQEIAALGERYVVASMELDDATGGINRHTWQYENAHLWHNRLYFARYSSTNLQNGVEHSILYHPDLPELVIGETTRKNDVVLSSSTSELRIDPLPASSPGGRKHLMASLAKTTEVKRDPNGKLLSEQVTLREISEFGNEIVKVVSDGVGTRTTTSTFENHPDTWTLNRLTRTSTVHSMAGAPDIIRTASFLYDPATGMLMQEVIEPDVPAYREQIDYQRDAYGNIVTTTRTRPGKPDEVTRITYDTRGRFIAQTIDPSGETLNNTHDTLFGGITNQRETNGAATIIKYDGFGRPIETLTPDLRLFIGSYEYCAVADAGTDPCPAHAAFVFSFLPSYVEEGPGYRIVYDRMEHLIAQDMLQQDGAWVRRQYNFNNLGSPVEMSEPFLLPGPAPYWITGDFDELERITFERYPDGTQDTYIYDGLTTTINDSYGRVTTTIKDARGRQVSVEQSGVGITRYFYDAVDNVIRSVDPDGAEQLFEYDPFGRPYEPAEELQ